MGLIVLILVSLFFAQRNLTSVARSWDLDRVERYIRLCRDKLEAEARAVPSEESLRDLQNIGLFIDVFPPETEIPQPNPRYVPRLHSVEAWDVVRGPDGQPVSVIRIGRYDSTARLTMRAVRYYTIAGAIGGALLILTTWLLLRRAVFRQILRLTEEVATNSLNTPAAIPATEPLDALRAAIHKAIGTRDDEAALRQRLLDGHHEPACTSKTDGTLHEVNAAYCRMFGKTRAELVGTNYLDLIPPSDRGDALNSLRRLSRRHPMHIVEHRVVLPDGTTRWMRWRDQAVIDETEQVIKVLSFGTDISAEKALETRLSGLQLAFNQMQSLARTGSLTWDIVADRMDWTEETFRLLGRERDETLPSLTALLDTVAPEDRGPLQRLFERAREHGDPFEHEFCAMLPDGSRRVLQSRAEVRADPKTKLLGQLTCTLRDITALRDAESATRRELRLREAVEQSLAAGISASDNQGRVIRVNPAFCAMTGFSREELVGSTAPYPYWPEEEIPNIHRAFESALAGQTPPQGYELKFCRKDGTRFDVLVKVAPLLDSDDKQLGWLGAVTDITLLQEARRGLQQAESSARQESLYRQAIEQSLDVGIVLRDPSGKTLSVNPAFVRMVGFSEEELLAAQPPNEPYWPEEEKTNITKALGEALAGRSTPAGYELIFQRKDGTRFDVLVKVAQLLDSNGKQLGWLGAVSDVSAIQQTRRELAEAESRLRGQLNYQQAAEKSITAGLIAIGFDGRPLSVNDAYCRMVGYTHEEIMAMLPPYPLWPEEDREKIQEAFDLHLKGEAPPGGFQLRFRRKDGSLIDVLISVSNLRGKDGDPIGVLSSLADITPLKDAERRLAITNERLQIAQDVAAFGIWDWDPAADTLYWDANSFAMFGHPEATDAKAVWRKVHSEEERERLTFGLRRLIESGGDSGQDTLSVQWPDGSRHEILSTYVIIRAQDGRATRVIGVNRDTTTEIEAARELRNAQERLAAALEIGVFGTFEHVFGVGAINWNAANYEIHGIDPSITDPEALFRAWKSVVGPDYQAIEQAVSSLPLEKNSITYDFGLRLPGSRESRRVRSSVFVERDNNGRPVRLVGVSRRID